MNNTPCYGSNERPANGDERSRPGQPAIDAIQNNLEQVAPHPLERIQVTPPEEKDKP